MDLPKEYIDLTIIYKRGQLPITFLRFTLPFERHPQLIPRVADACMSPLTTDEKKSFNHWVQGLC